MTASAPSVPWGTAATVTVNVSAGSSAVTGQVALTEGSTDRGIVNLQNGQATFSLPVGLAGGDHTLTATYSGNDQLNAASAQATVTVVLPTARSKTLTYQAGDTVSFSSQVYQAGWYSKGGSPRSTSEDSCVWRGCRRPRCQ